MALPCVSHLFTTVVLLISNCAFVVALSWCGLTNKGWNQFGSLRHSSKFQRFSRLDFITAPTSLTGGQPNFPRCLAVSWSGTLRCIYTFWGLLPYNGIFTGAKCTLHLNLALSYIGSVTARHSRSGRQPNFSALSRRRHLCSEGRSSRWAWRPSRWASAHILVSLVIKQVLCHFLFIFVRKH